MRPPREALLLTAGVAPLGCLCWLYGHALNVAIVLSVVVYFGSLMFTRWTRATRKGKQLADGGETPLPINSEEWLQSSAPVQGILVLSLLFSSLSGGGRTLSLSSTLLCLSGLVASTFLLSFTSLTTLVHCLARSHLQGALNGQTKYPSSFQMTLLPLLPLLVMLSGGLILAGMSILLCGIDSSSYLLALYLLINLWMAQESPVLKTWYRKGQQTLWAIGDDRTLRLGAVMVLSAPVALELLLLLTHFGFHLELLILRLLPLICFLLLALTAISPNEPSAVFRVPLYRWLSSDSQMLVVRRLMMFLPSVLCASRYIVHHLIPVALMAGAISVVEASILASGCWASSSRPLQRLSEAGALSILTGSLALSGGWWSLLEVYVGLAAGNLLQHIWQDTKPSSFDGVRDFRQLGSLALTASACLVIPWIGNLIVKWGAATDLSEANALESFLILGLEGIASLLFTSGARLEGFSAGLVTFMGEMVHVRLLASKQNDEESPLFLFWALPSLLVALAALQCQVLHRYWRGRCSSSLLALVTAITVSQSLGCRGSRRLRLALGIHMAVILLPALCYKPNHLKDSPMVLAVASRFDDRIPANTPLVLLHALLFPLTSLFLVRQVDAELSKELITYFPKICCAVYTCYIFLALGWLCRRYFPRKVLFLRIGAGAALGTSLIILMAPAHEMQALLHSATTLEPSSSGDDNAWQDNGLQPQLLVRLWLAVLAGCHALLLSHSIAKMGRSARSGASLVLCGLQMKALLSLLPVEPSLSLLFLSLSWVGLSLLLSSLMGPGAILWTEVRGLHLAWNAFIALSLLLSSESPIEVCIMCGVVALSGNILVILVAGWSVARAESLYTRRYRVDRDRRSWTKLHNISLSCMAMLPVLWHAAQALEQALVSSGATKYTFRVSTFLAAGSPSLLYFLKQGRLSGLRGPFSRLAPIASLALFHLSLSALLHQWVALVDGLHRYHAMLPLLLRVTFEFICLGLDVMLAIKNLKHFWLPNRLRFSYRQWLRQCSLMALIGYVTNSFATRLLVLGSMALWATLGLQKWAKREEKRLLI